MEVKMKSKFYEQEPTDIQYLVQQSFEKFIIWDAL